MNRKIFLIVTVVVIVAVGGLIAFRVLTSFSASPLKTTVHNYNGLDLKVVYCRPSKRGRLIFGDSVAGALVPFGKYWRLGANDATEITFSKDVIIGDKPLKAGSYRLYAVPGERSWQITFNTELGKWGYNPPNHDLDVLTTVVSSEKVSSETELLTLSFTNNSNGVSMNLDWDKTHLSLPIVVQ
jgi:hypothetical protein